MNKCQFLFFRATVMIGSICGLLLSVLLCTEDAIAATYYISPVGKDSNTGSSTSSPWLTFKKALATVHCGDTLNLMNGVYGDGTGTGKADLSNRICTSGNVLTIRALNQRKAWIKDAGRGISMNLKDIAYVTIDGIVMSSKDNNYDPNAYEQYGYPLRVTSAHHVIVKNVVLSNPNRYGNLPLANFSNVDDSVIEDSEFYNFHRHAIATGAGSTRVTFRRIYCNPRIGGVSGGLPTTNGTGGGDACVALYPCQDCIVENAIADGSPKTLHIVELNANGSSPLAGNKVLGSIGYKTSNNGIYINSRGIGLAYTPQNTLLENIVIYNHKSASGIRSSDAKNTMIKNVTIMGSGAPVGIGIDQRGYGDGVYSTTMQNVLSFNHSSYGVMIKGVSNWSGVEINEQNNKYGVYPKPPSRWVNLTSHEPVLGTCVAWIPDGSPMKRAGTSGKDIGANVLYRYQNGVLTNVPLWNKTTGAFPHGALVPGLNNIAGQSLYDLHIRLNINRNGCSFPAAYKASTTTLAAPTSARSL